MQFNAKNVILFVGDGMGVSTLTASRIIQGQLAGIPDEESYLSFENFPHTALNQNLQC
jgi:alkaline phosphatase